MCCVLLAETLRKYPPLTFLNRHCTKNYRIPGTDLVVEKGVQVVIPVLGLHKDPRYFPDPEKFDPERFGEEYKSGRPNYVYLPFGEGLRICIGNLLPQWLDIRMYFKLVFNDLVILSCH
jgi:cytochrome P450 family 6